MADITQLELKVAELVRLLLAENNKKAGTVKPCRAEVKYLTNAIASTQYKIAKQASIFLQQRNYTTAGQLRKVWHIIPK